MSNSSVTPDVLRAVEIRSPLLPMGIIQFGMKVHY